MSWSNRWVGIPKLDHGRSRCGVDCWGLVYLVYREDLGITLPDYDGYGSVAEHAEIASLIDGAAQSAIWQRADDPLPYDVAMFRLGRWNAHVGLVVRPGLMLHVTGDASKHEHLGCGPWMHRLQGYWRPREPVLEGRFNG